MPGMNGLELQAHLARRGVPLPVIIVTAHGDVATARSALKGGAVDFIEKPIDDEALVAAIAAARDRDAREREAGAGGRRRCRALRAADRRASARCSATRRRGPPQPRDRASLLGISPRTVEVYKARMMEKLQVRRVPDLVRLAPERQPPQ